MVPHNKPDKKALADLSVVEVARINGTKPNHARNDRSKSGNERTKRRAEPEASKVSASAGVLARTIANNRVECSLFGAEKATASCMHGSLSERIQFPDYTTANFLERGR